MLPRRSTSPFARALSRWLVAGALTVSLASGLLACSDDAGSGDPGGGTESTGSEAGAPTGSSGSPSASADPASDPSGPFVVAATAVAERSREVVVRLHSLAVATTGEGRLPAPNLGELAAAARRDFTALVGDATMMTPPRGSVAEALVSSLATYGRLARILADWRAEDPPLADRFFADLATVDEAWTAALADLEELSGTSLLDEVPELAFPEDTR